MHASQPPLISREEWALEVEVEEDMKLMIVAARWIYHCERCKIDMGQRRMNIKIVMQKLDRRLETAEEAQTNKDEVAKKRKEEANKKKQQAIKNKEQKK